MSGSRVGKICSIFLIIIAIMKKGQTASLQTGFNLHLLNIQEIKFSRPTLVGPWETKPNSGSGVFLSGVTFDSLHSTAIIPRSGIYFVSVKIQVSGLTSKSTCTVTSSLSDRVLTAWTGDSSGEESKEIFLTGSLRLSIGEELQVLITTEQIGLKLEKGSLFSLKFQGNLGPLPSFLASPFKTQKFMQNVAFRIPSWKAHHKSSTSFSSATGTFMPNNVANYLCSLNLWLGRAFGTIVVEVRTEKEVLLSVEKNFHRITATTVHISQIFSLNQNEAISLWLQPLNDSLVVSSNTTYSCFLVGKEKRSITLSVPNITTVSYSNWREISFWKVQQQSTDFTIFNGEGKIFFQTSIALVSLSLTMKSDGKSIVSIAMLSGGVAERISSDDGIIKSLQLSHGSLETLTLTGALKVTKDSYISAFIKSSKTISIIKATIKVVRNLPIVPSVILSMSQGETLKNQTRYEYSWNTVNFNQHSTQQSTSQHWYFAKDYFSPKEDGIYYISINLIIDILKNMVQNALIVAKLVSKSQGKTRELMRVFRGTAGISNSIHLISIFSLRADERISLLYRCDGNIHCNASKSSAFSAVLMARTFRAEGFSTTLIKSRISNITKQYIINEWKTSDSNFMFANSFNARKGEYVAAYDGIYMITCSILLRNMTKDDTVKLQIKTGDESKSSIEDIGQQKAYYNYDYGTTLSISSAISLQTGQLVTVRLVTNKLLNNVRIVEHSTLAILAITQPGLAAPFGFTMSMMRTMNFYRIAQSIQKLQGWTTDNLNGAFNTEKRQNFHFLDKRGTLSVSKPAILLLTINAHVGAQDLQKIVLQINVNDIQRIESVDFISMKQTMKLSVALFVQAEQMISFEVKAESRLYAPRYEVLKNTVISAVFLQDVPLKPGSMLSIRRFQTTKQIDGKDLHFKFQNDVSGCYKQNLAYKNEGFFEIPFAGNYIISLNLRVEKHPKNSSASCGIHVNSGKHSSSLAYRPTNKQNQFQLTNVLRFESPGKVSFVCRSPKGSLVVKRNSYIMINFLDYSRMNNISIAIKKKQTADRMSRYTTIHNVTGSGPYLLAVNKNRRLLSFNVFHDGEAVIEVNNTLAQSRNTVYLALNLKQRSTVDLECIEKSERSSKEEITFYKINKNLGGMSFSISQNEVLYSKNLSWALIKNWENYLQYDFISLRDSYLASGLFISKQNAKYLITAVINFMASKERKRDVYLIIDGIFTKDAQSVPVCDAVDNAVCTVTITTALHLQKWQSVGVYIHFETYYDEIKVLKGSRLSVLLLDVGVRSYLDDGPNIVIQPWPKYINESTMFNWSCSAVGSKHVAYSWKRIGFSSNKESVVAKGKTVTLFGRPEESGYYFCSAEMNGTIHNSHVATVNISDTNECVSNETEHQNICHKDANCINTIGSYYCECKTGFRGDGSNLCSDVDECLVNTTCHSMADCSNTIGSYKCQCKTGFTGNGKMCKDINECLGTNSCHEHSNCFNTEGSYYCDCKKGYKGNGFNCKNINECNLDDDEYPCDVNADCTDATGTFYCSCKKGWTGNGTICEDINECQTLNCTGNATCINLPGTYRCKCNQGYREVQERCDPLGCIPPSYCSGEFKAAWWTRSPYLANTSSQEPVGLFKDLLKQVVISCCDNCSLLSFVGPYNGSFDVEAAIEANDTVDFGCPLYGSPDQTLFRGYPFMSVVEAPGIAFFIKDQPKQKSAVLGSLGSSWPILAITFLLACLSGIIIWFLDTVRNPTEFPNSFIGGSWEGFWWAFITMTTVGYGDKAPRSFGARLFGIIWILIGLVIISTFTATITTMLTASSLSDEVKLYGMKVGVLHNSEEYRLGVKRNAETKSFSSVAEIVRKVKDKTVQGILLDAYIAGEYQDKLEEVRLHQVIDYIFSYGVVLSRDGLALRECFSHFLESKQSQIYATISKVIKPLKQTKNSASLAAQKSASIFDSESPQFKYILYFGLGLFFVLLIIGIIWEYINSRKRQRRYSRTETDDPQERGLTEWKVQWESGKISHFHGNIFRNEIADLKKHIREFSDSWVNRLDELEAKQAREIQMAKKTSPKVIQEKSKVYRIGKMTLKCPKDGTCNENQMEMLPK